MIYRGCNVYIYVFASLDLGSTHDMALAIAAIAACGDVVMSLATAPLDRATVILQTQTLNSSPRKGELSRGLADCLSNLKETGGVLALWRGSNAEITKSYAIVLSQVVFRLNKSSSINEMQAKRKVLFKTIKALLSGTIAYPLTIAKTRLAVGMDQTSGIVDSWKRMLSGKTEWKEWTQTIYSGLVPELISEVAMRLVFYGAFAAGTQLLLEGQNQDKAADDRYDAVAKFATTQAAAVVALAAAHPFHTVQARMAICAGGEEEFDSMQTCGQALYDKEGVAGFYRGFLPAWISQVVKNGIFYNGIWYIASGLLENSNADVCELESANIESAVA